MTENKNYNKINKSKIIISAFLIVFILFLYSLVNGLLSSKEKIVLPEIGTLYSKTKVQGITIKKETVYYADTNGQLNTLANEGERVAFGEEVANININKENSTIINEIDSINKQIDKLVSTANKSLILNNSNMEKEEVIENIISDLQLSINDRKYDEIIFNIDYLKDSNNNTQNNETLIDISLSALQKEKDKLTHQLENKTEKYYSGETGIVSYYIDGYENVYIPKDFENYTYENISKAEIEFEDKHNANSCSNDVRAGQAIFKIIDNFKWNLAIIIDNLEDINGYEAGKRILIEFEDETELEGKIVAINITGNKAALIIEFNTYLHENYNIRNTFVNIIHSKKEGLKIPTDVIIEKDGIFGVLIKDISGVVLFKQISIIGVEGDYTYIDKGNSNGYIEEKNGKKYKTVNLYDEIFIDPYSVTEGEILK